MNAQDFNALTSPDHPINVIYKQQQELQDQAMATLSVNKLNEVAEDGSGVLLNSAIGTRVDGIIFSKRLNAISLFADISHPFTLNSDVFSEDNVLHIKYEGRIFQETGSDQIVTPKIFLGPLADENRVDSGKTITVSSASTSRSLTYEVKITRAPNLGNYVLVTETVVLGKTVALQETSIKAVTYATNLADINSLIVQIVCGAAATTYLIYSDLITIWIEQDARDDDQLIWYSQPMGSDSYDTTIESSTPNINYATDVGIRFGEPNSTTGNVRRTLIKIPDLTNLASIIDQYTIVSAYLFLRILADYSDNARTFRFYRLLRNWDLTTCTYNNYSTGNAWGTAGVGNNTTDYDGSVEVGTISMATAETLNTVKSVTLDPTIILGMIDGSLPNYGFLGKADTEFNDGYNFHSGDATSKNNAPILYVVLQRKQ